MNTTSQLGPFPILKKIGQGGMGVVFEALDSSTGKHVAIKMLKQNHASELESVQRFYREITASQALSHPNIVPILAVGELEGTHYYVMPLIKGESLDKVLKKRKIQVNEAIQIAIQIASGLAHAHERGIIHRDVKPGNIMLLEDHVLILDFGLAKAEWTPRLTMTGTVIGTPVYMSPEQSKAMELDHRTDVYSLGVTLYEMLTSTPPFLSQSLPELLEKIIYEKPIEPQKMNPEVTDNLSYVLMKAMEKNKEDRYSSIGEMKNDLEKCFHNIPIKKRKNWQKYYHIVINIFFFFFCLLGTLWICSFFSPPNTYFIREISPKKLHHSKLCQKKLRNYDLINSNTFFYIFRKQKPIKKTKNNKEN